MTFYDFVHKWESAIDGMTVSVSVGVTRQPAPYESLRAERMVSCTLKGDEVAKAADVTANLQAAVLSDLQSQLHEASQQFYGG